MNIYFNHGKESGPWGTKISTLATIAQNKGFRVESPDYSNQPDPDARVEQLLRLSMKLPTSDLTVLVGSSMGGYVATVASQRMNPVGLFLMAPAFYFPGYKEQPPTPHARKTVIVHGLQDDVVPVENSIRFAREHNTELYLIDGDHRLNDQLPKIKILFDLFLDDVIELSDLPKILTWEKISQKIGQNSCWIEWTWRQMASAGLTSYLNESERINVILRFIALTDFYSEYLYGFAREVNVDPQDTAKLFDLPNAVLDNLLAEFTERQGDCYNDAPTIEMALEEIARQYIYPIMIQYYGNIDAIAASIHRSSSSTFYEGYSEEYLVDPEDPDAEENAKILALNKITEWLSYKLG